VTIRAYYIFIDTVCEGHIPSVRGENDLPFVFPARVEAECETADNMITRLQEFIDGDRDFADAMTVDEYVTEVTVPPDGSVVDERGNHFKSRQAKT
jgi:hypothetical protein